MAFDSKPLKDLIIKTLPDAKVEVEDLTGDGRHYGVAVTSKAFQGRSLLQQHKMVYDALGDVVGTRYHAVQLKTRVPS